MRFEKDTLRNIMDMQYKNYKLSKESIDIVNQKYHDLKHQINLLKSGADSEKAGEYLEQMEREIKREIRSLIPFLPVKACIVRDMVLS